MLIQQKMKKRDSWDRPGQQIKENCRNVETLAEVTFPPTPWWCVLAWKHSLGNFRLGSFTGELRSRTFAWGHSLEDLSLESFRSGGFAWEL